MSPRIVLLDREHATAALVDWVRGVVREYSRSAVREWLWNPAETLAAIEALPEKTPDAVEAAFADPSKRRTYPECDLCGARVEHVARLGENPPDYDRSTIDACRACLVDALGLLPTLPHLPATGATR